MCQHCNKQHWNQNSLPVPLSRVFEWYGHCVGSVFFAVFRVKYRWQSCVVYISMSCNNHWSLSDSDKTRSLPQTWFVMSFAVLTWSLKWETWLADGRSVHGMVHGGFCVLITFVLMGKNPTDWYYSKYEQQHCVVFYQHSACCIMTSDHCRSESDKTQVIATDKVRWVLQWCFCIEWYDAWQDPAILTTFVLNSDYNGLVGFVLWYKPYNARAACLKDMEIVPNPHSNPKS